MIGAAAVAMRLADGAEVVLNPGGWVAWAVAGLLAGWLAGHLVRGRGFGCLGDIVLGLIGAAIGGFVLSQVPLGISGEQGFWGTVVIAFLGAFVLALIGRIIGGGRKRESEANTRWEW